MQKLYLIECQEFFKIGIANDVLRRLESLATGNPFELRLVAIYGYENAQIVEAALHQRFSAQRVRGEWFKLNDDDLNNFHMLCQGLGGEVIPVDELSKTSQLPTDDDELFKEEDEIIRTSEIIQMHMNGASQRQIEIGLFGYSGGFAATKVSETIKMYVERNNNDA